MINNNVGYFVVVLVVSRNSTQGPEDLTYRSYSTIKETFNDW